MQQVRPRWNYADLERMPDDGPRYELYDGELSEVPTPIPRHQRVAHKIANVLEEYERAAGGLVLISPIDVVLDDHNVVQPDVVFFTPARVGSIDMRKAIRIPPDLAIEVLSPSTSATDRGKKSRLLARFGVPEYWIVDPVDNRIERHVLQQGSYVLDGIASQADTMTSRALPGLQFSTARVFAR
jgi:Uma2 family endonuclease